VVAVILVSEFLVVVGVLGATGRPGRGEDSTWTTVRDNEPQSMGAHEW
jgi:hypothetical protein